MDLSRPQDAESGDKSKSNEDDSGSGDPAALDSAEEIQTSSDEEYEQEIEQRIGDDSESTRRGFGIGYEESSTIAINNQQQQSIEEDVENEDEGTTKMKNQTIQRQITLAKRGLGGLPLVSSMNIG